MNADQSYTVDLGADSTADITGTYTIKVDKVTIQDETGSDCLSKGIYKFNIDGDQLTNVLSSTTRLISFFTNGSFSFPAQISDGEEKVLSKNCISLTYIPGITFYKIA
jgi:hypothetical protein